MKISLLRNPIDTSSFCWPEEEFTDIREVLNTVCEAADDERWLSFDVEFSDETWPVTVATDLSILLEQLPAALLQLERGLGFGIDFYEQGMERSLQFSPHSTGYRVECRFLPNSVLPLKRNIDPSRRWTETVASESLRSMLHGVLLTFLELVSALQPRASDQDLITRWSAGHPIGSSAQ